VISIAAQAFSEGEKTESWAFEDVTAKVIDRNPVGKGPIFDYAFLDINDDNYLDIVVNNHHRSQGAPIWLGTPEHTFKLWKTLPDDHMPIAGFFLGEVDLNGDGKTDLVYTGNEGGVVVNINTTEARAHEPTYKPVPIHTSSPLTSFADFDGDGTLEVLCRPARMYDNTLTSVVQTNLHFGGSTVSDFDNDGWPDLFASGADRGKRKHWSGPRRLFRNDNGKLVVVKSDSDFVTGYRGGLVRSGDFNNDGNMDLSFFGVTPLITDSEGKPGKGIPMQLWLGDGQFGFTDVSEISGVSASTQKSGYSMVYLADIDNNTFLDIVNQGNYGTRCWKNNGDGTFTEFKKKGAIPWAGSAHLRLDDYDMDGRLDVVTSAPGAGWKDRKTTIRVFRNLIDNGNKWLKIQLRQPGANTMGVGASVTLYKPGTREIVGKRMLLCDTTGYHPRLHFGLGKNEEVDVEVLFPVDRKIKRFAGIEANRYVVLRPDGSVKDVEFGGR
jgi:hypothetical protein